MTLQGVRNIRYLFTDLFGFTRCELPLTSVTFSQVLNGSGQFSGVLNIEDPTVQSLPWIPSTAPNLGCVWVLVDGVANPVYGGLLCSRQYQASQHQVQIRAMDFWAYFSQRVQAVDYSTTWTTVPAGASTIAYQILTDTLAVGDSLPITVGPAATVFLNHVTLAAPLSQRQSVNSLVSQLSGMGYGVGFDFASDAFMVEQYMESGQLGALPQGQISLAYPRRGRATGTTGLMVDLAVADDFWWSEDGTQQATTVYEMGTATGGVSQTGSYTPANVSYGYPFTEKVVSHPAFSSTSAVNNVMNAYLSGDLMVCAFPQTVGQVQIDLFGTPSLGSWIVGDDIRVVNQPRAGGTKSDPRFPNGLDTYLRIVQADVTISEQGRSVAKLTLNVPPGVTPTAPPQ